MTVHLHQPAGKHSRHGVDALAHNLLRFLLWLLPIEPGAPETWHTVACAAGDLVAEFFALLAVVVLGVGAVAAVAIIMLILVLLSPVLAVSVAALAVVVAWWWLLAWVRRVERAVDQEARR